MKVIRLTERLWSEYVHQNRIKASRKAAENRLRRKREALIVEHMAVAEAIARQVWHRFTRLGQAGYGAKIELEDMIACAHVGLVEAAGRWDPSRGDFAKYCYFRVRGAIIDAHRRQAYLETQHSSIDEWLENENLQVDGGHGAPWIAQYLADNHPLADQIADRNKLRRIAAQAIERLLPDDEREVIREALGGANVAAIGKARGRSSAWARAKLTAARDTVAAEVQRRAA